MSNQKNNKENEVSFSDSASQVKELRYESSLTRSVYENEVLKPILDKITTIDFVFVYHQDNENLLSYLENLRAELEQTTNEDEKEELRRKLHGYEPAVKVKHTIVITNLLKVAEDMGKRMGIINGSPYIYNGAYWEVFCVELISCFLAAVAINSGYKNFQAHKDSTVKMLFNQFNLTAILNTPKPNANRVMINLLNGTFVYDNGKYSLESFSHSDMLTYQLNFEYNPDAECPKYMAFLNEIMKELDAQDVMAEYVAYIIAKQLRLEQCLVLIGTGRNGKSTWGDIIAALLGKENVAPFSLIEACDTTGYYRAEIGKYLLCYSSEMSTKGCSPDLVKQLISGQDVVGRVIFKSPTIISNYCRFLFSTNVLPRDIEQSEGYFRRFMFLKFAVEIPKEKVNPNLANEIISDELSGVLNWVIKGLERLIANKKFSYCAKIENMNNRFKTESSSVAMYMQENNYKHSVVKHATSKELYFGYKNYCEENGSRPVSSIEFIRRLEDQLKFTIKRKATGNATWVYCEKTTSEVEVSPAISEAERAIKTLFKL